MKLDWRAPGEKQKKNIFERKPYGSESYSFTSGLEIYLLEIPNELCDR